VDARLPEFTQHHEKLGQVLSVDSRVLPVMSLYVQGKRGLRGLRRLGKPAERAKT
jgi:hypothetical protein